MSVSDDQLHRFGELINGFTEPVNFQERMFLDAFNLVYFENKSPTKFAEKVHLDTMLDTPAGVMLLGVVMAVMKRKTTNKDFEDGGDPNKVH